MQSKFIIAYLVIFILGLVASLTGCDPVQRHKILTFFFDGVPSLGGETADFQRPPHEPRGDCNLCHKQVKERPRADSKSPPHEPRGDCNLCHKQVRERPETVWFVHKANKTCTNCHERRTQSRWSLPKFIAPVPQLCYRCHTDFSTSKPYVHGPVVVGECLFCHEAHKSKIAGLLKKKEPELCYQCHEDIEAAQISGHPPEPVPQCTNCHDPHAGSDRMLLKR